MFRFLKRAAVFLLGSYTIIAQVTFLREFLVIFFGNELCLGVIFSSWFLGMGIGAILSARVARRTAEGEGPFLFLGSILVVISPVILLLIRVLRELLLIQPGGYISFTSLLFSTWILVLPFSFIIGFAFPFACLLALRGEKRGIRNVGYVYILEALGSMVGGAIFSFLLVGRISAFYILFLWGALILVVLFLLSWERRRTGFVVPVFSLLLAIFLTILLTGLAGRIDSWSVLLRWKSLNPHLPLIASVESRYENIALARRAEQYDLFGNGQYYFSFPDPYGYSATAHMIMSEHPDPRRLLLIGGGTAGMIRELLKYDLDRLHYVELDPKLLLLMEQYLTPSEREIFHKPPVKVYYGDGRRFVKETAGKYDLIMVNVPDPSTAMLNRYYTLEFYNEVKRIMSPGGVMMTSISAPVDYYGREVANYAGSVYRTLKASFPYVIVTPTEENYFFASSKPGVVSSDIATLTKRWLSRGIETRYFTQYHFLMWWLPERVAFTRSFLEAQKAAPIDTDFKPITYFFNLVLWGRFSGSGIISLLDRLEGIDFSWYLIPVLLILAVRLLYLRATGKRGDRQHSCHALLAIGTTGFTAMALEIVLVFAFQNIYGYVYQMLGLIVALFMTGLACGGFFSNRLLLRPERRWVLWLAGMEFILAVYSLMIPWMVSHLTSESLGAKYAFMALVFLAGLLTGAEFPLGSRIYMQYASNLGRTAALVDAFDNFGACFGALLTGVIFVPILGFRTTCMFLLVINSATGLLLLLGYRHREVGQD